MGEPECTAGQLTPRSRGPRGHRRPVSAGTLIITWPGAARAPPPGIGPSTSSCASSGSGVLRPWPWRSRNSYPFMGPDRSRMRGRCHSNPYTPMRALKLQDLWSKNNAVPGQLPRAVSSVIDKLRRPDAWARLTPAALPNQTGRPRGSSVSPHRMRTAVGFGIARETRPRGQAARLSSFLNTLLLWSNSAFTEKLRSQRRESPWAVHSASPGVNLW